MFSKFLVAWLQGMPSLIWANQTEIMPTFNDFKIMAIIFKKIQTNDLTKFFIKNNAIS